MTKTAYKIVITWGDDTTEQITVTREHNEWHHPDAKDPFISLGDVIGFIESHGGFVIKLERVKEDNNAGNS